MDRESYDVSVRTSGDGRPVLAVAVTDDSADVADRLSGADGARLSAGDVDVTFRETAGESSGVLALADRLTGEFVLEADLESEPLSALVEAVLATDEGDGGQFELRLTNDEAESFAFEKETLLVYDAEGNLERGRSLIPGGVEL